MAFNAEIIGIWFSVLLTLSIFSYLYGDNPFYKAAEHIFVGVSAGYIFAIMFWDTVWPNLFGRLMPGFVDAGFDFDATYLIPLVLGVFMLCRLSPKLSRLSRISIAYIVGMAAGMKIYVFLNSDIIGQIQGTTINLNANIWSIFNQVIIIVGVISGLIYFFFSKEHKGSIGKISKIGIFFLMIKFGAAFGFTVMGRLALLIGRFEELILYSSSDYNYASILILFLMILVLGYWAFNEKKSKETT